MKRKYLLAGSAFVAFLFVMSAVFVADIGSGNEEVRSTTESYVVESPHNYYNNMDETYTIHVEGAEWIKVHFTKIYMERNYDFLYIYDGDYNQIYKLTGYYRTGGTTQQLTGDTVYIRLTSDYTVTKYGFKTDWIEYELGSTPPPDTTPPTVSITAPADGATVSGVTTVNVASSDNEDTSPDNYLSIDGGSYFAIGTSYDWDTETVSNGAHTLQARAIDDAGNIGYSSVVDVTVDNTVEPPPVEDGDTHFLGAVAGGEVDYYDIYAYAGGAAISVSVSWDGGNDIDCYIMTSPDYTSYLARGYTTNNPETCSYTPTADGTYYIGVRMYTSGAASTDYDCHVTWQATEPEPPPPPTGDAWAIIVGISDYKAISDLSYCDEDATDWYNYLVNTMGYETSNIRVLGDGHTSNYPAYYAIATEYNYRVCLNWVADNIGAGDVCVFATSGHGSGNGAGSSYLCAWDCGSGESGHDGDFYDTEIDDYTDDISQAGGNVFVFIDHCYSGGIGPEVTDGTYGSNVYCVTTCTEDGYGYDDPTHSNGMWTYWFLEAGLIGHFGSSTTTTMGAAFDWALANYPRGGGDTPMQFNDAYGNNFVL
jgi:hypothetical protein